jgi:hypothetical protein
MTWQWHTYDISNDIPNDIRVHTMTNSRLLFNYMAMTYLWHTQWHTQWHTSTYNDKLEVFIKLHGNDIPNNIPNDIPNDIRVHAMTNSRFLLNDMAMTYLWHIQWHTKWHTQWHTVTYNNTLEVFIKWHTWQWHTYDISNAIPNDIRVHTMTNSRLLINDIHGNDIPMTYPMTYQMTYEYIQWQTRGLH